MPARISSTNSPKAQPRARLTRDQKRAANRQRLLDAALDVFSQRGYYAATIEEIVEASGLSNGALYYNFRNKEELFLALFDQRFEARIAAVEQSFGTGQSSRAETDRKVEAAALQSVRELDDPREWAMFFEFVAHAGRAAPFRREFRKRSRRLRAVFARAVEDQSAALGAELALPAEQAAVAITALTHGLAVQRITDPRAVPDELLGQLIVYLLRGMAAVGSAGRGAGRGRPRRD